MFKGLKFRISRLPNRWTPFQQGTAGLNFRYLQNKLKLFKTVYDGSAGRMMAWGSRDLSSNPSEGDNLFRLKRNNSLGRVLLFRSIYQWIKKIEVNIYPKLLTISPIPYHFKCRFKLTIFHNDVTLKPRYTTLLCPPRSFNFNNLFIKQSKKSCIAFGFHFYTPC